MEKNKGMSPQVRVQKKANELLNSMNSRFSGLLEELNLLEDVDPSGDEDLFEDTNSMENEDLFEDTNLFENEDTEENLSEGVYLGHEVIDGERVEYFMTEPGEYSKSLDESLASFRVKRRAYVNRLLEDVIFDNFMENLMEGKKIVVKRKDGSSYKRVPKNITKKMDPTRKINLLKKRKSIMAIFRFNKKLRKKLERFANAEGQSRAFNDAFIENLDWIPVNIRGVLKKLSAKERTFKKTKEMLTKQLKTLKDATPHEKDTLALLVLDGINNPTDSTKEGVEAIKGSLGNFEAMINKMASSKEKTASLLLEGLFVESVEDLEYLMEAVKTDDKKPDGRYGKNKANEDTVKGMFVDSEGVEAESMPDGVNAVISELGPYLVAASMYGAGTGKYSAKFFAAVDRAGKAEILTTTAVQQVMDIRKTRALAGKMAHDFKWLAILNKAGLLGSKISMKQKSKGANGKMKTKSFAIKGADSIKKWLKTNSNSIEKVMLYQVPNGGWGGHRVGGRRNPSESQMKRLGVEQGKNVRKNLMEDVTMNLLDDGVEYLLEDADAFSPDNLALIVELI